MSLLQQYVLADIFAIDVRTDKRIDFVGGIRGPEELERLVDSENGHWPFPCIQRKWPIFWQSPMREKLCHQNQLGLNQNC